MTGEQHAVKTSDNILSDQRLQDSKSSTLTTSQVSEHQTSSVFLSLGLLETSGLAFAVSEFSCIFTSSPLLK